MHQQIFSLFLKEGVCYVRDVNKKFEKSLEIITNIIKQDKTRSSIQLNL